MTHPFEHLLATATEKPLSTAIVSPDVNITFDELLDSSVRMARHLRSRGLRPGDIVGVSAPPLVALAVAEALFHEACVGSEIPEVSADVDESFFDWLIVSDLRPDLPPEKQILLDAEFFDSLARTEPACDPLPYPDDDALCRVNFSSGTTGRAKAIPVSIRCLEDRSLVRRHQWMLDEPYLCLLGLSTGLAFMTFYAAVARGETFFLPATGSTSSAYALRLIKRYRVSCIMGSPHQLGLLLEAAAATPDDFESVTTVMSAGSVMPDFVALGLERRFRARFVSTYASSEAGSVALRIGVGAASGLAGTLLDDVDVVVVDEQGLPVSDGVHGRIGIRRAHQPQHYLNDPETTAATFRDGYFFPGDEGYLVGTELYLAGRTSEIINAAGVKVDPARIEAIVHGFGGITDAAAFALVTPQGLTKLALVFVTRDDVERKALIGYLKQQLGEACPAYVARVQAIDRNHMGKVNRDELARIFAPRLLPGPAL